MRCLAFVLTWCVAMLLAAPSFGQPSGTATAADLKQRGIAAMDALRYDEAIDDFTRAYALSGDASLLYDRGRARQARSEFPEALQDIQRFAREASPELKSRVPKLDELLAELRSHVGILTLTSNVTGARVLVRSKEVGTTPLAGPLTLSTGPATVQVVADGYQEWHRDLVLVAGTPVTLDAELLSRSNSSVLHVASSTPGARIVVDDRVLGGSPAETSLPAGPHRVVVHAEGYDDADLSVVLGSGETKDVNVEPRSRPGLMSRWWFWTAVGVVVAAGVVTTYALVTERSADHGSFQPGQVSAPLRSLAQW
jgi:hypothetical protein